MKTFSICKYIVIVFCLFPLFSFSQKELPYQDFPPYESVVKHFYKNYKAIGLQSSGSILYFEKRPAGYFVSIADQYPYDNRKHKEMLWSYQTKTFKKLRQYNSSESDGYNSRYKGSTHMQSYNRHEFEFCPFAGYPGWQRDVIKHFGEFESLPDTLQYGLARAYSTLAANLMHYHYGNTDKTMQFNLPKKKNSMTNEQIETYRKYAHLARNHYFKLHEQNPDFETVVGKIYTKYCNEVVWNFLILQYFQNEKEARKELLPNLYDEFYINTAKNYLNSCPPNAILLTYGDNDTYPLLYVQAQLGFRTDVLIANTSLLATDRYINHLRDGVFDAAPYPMTLPPEAYADDKNNQILISKEVKEHLELRQAMSDVKNEKDTYTVGDKYLVTLPSQYFKINIDKEKVKTNVPSAQRNSIADTMKWKLPYRGSNIVKNDLAFLDMLAANDWKRPVCIGATCRKQNFIGMENYFQLEGLVYRMYPVENKKRHTYLIAGLHTEETYKKLTETFIWEGIDNLESKKLIYYSVYFSTFYEATQELIDNGKNEKAENLIDLFVKIFPNNKKAFDGNITLLSDQYLQLSKNKKAEKIGLQIIENFSKKEIKTEKDYFSMKQLRGQADKYDNQTLKDALAKINW